MSDKKDDDECYRPFEYLGDEKDDHEISHKYECKACGKKFRTCLAEDRFENTVVEDGLRMLKCPGCGVK